MGGFAQWIPGIFVVVVVIIVVVVEVLVVFIDPVLKKKPENFGIACHESLKERERGVGECQLLIKVANHRTLDAAKFGYWN